MDLMQLAQPPTAFFCPSAKTGNKDSGLKKKKKGDGEVETVEGLRKGAAAQKEELAGGTKRRKRAGYRVRKQKRGEF